MAHSLTGTRIREYRLRAGLSQTALARQAGISTSYLNLIEHNKRRIGGKVLLAIARELDVTAASLTEGADLELTGTLQEAAVHVQGPVTSGATLVEFAGKFPEWASLLASLYRQTRDQEQVIEALSDRLTHDPFLAESLHLMLSNITAIRSAAGILNSVDDITEAQQSRFHGAIYTESKRLSEAAQALTEYFDKAADQSAQSATPEEVLDRFLIKHQHCFPTLDQPDATQQDIEALLDTQEMSGNTPAQKLARKLMCTYLIDAQSMPLGEFTETAAASDYNPSALASTFRVSLHAVFRRLASLRRTGIDAPEIGLIMVNAAGHAFHRRPLTDFPLPRHANACPLWPLYQSLSQPERPLQGLVELPGNKQFATLCVALPRSAAEFGAQPEYQAAMLVLPHEGAKSYAAWRSAEIAAKPVGTSCRICPREDCAARSEDSVC